VKYRKFGSLDFQVSVLGFGAMRLPLDEQSRIMEEEAIRMIRHAIDNGVNYIDTAYPYHGGKSETIVGKALQDGYREKVYLATKSPVWMIKKANHFDRYLNRQIKRLQTTPDIYLFHGMNQFRFEVVKNLDLIEQMEKAREKGLFKYIGFSFHDNFDVFKEILDYHAWDCCQIQYNYLDINYQAGTRGVRYAGEKKVALIIMEPIRGGKLAIPQHLLDSKPEIKNVLDNAPIKRTLADWALQFVWSHPEVSVVLSGMSSMQHVIENVKSAENSGINHLSEEELKVIADLRAAYRKLEIIPCTNCQYCLPCPNGVSIPTNFNIVNELAYWGEKHRKKIANLYERMVKTPQELENRKIQGDEYEGAASLCIECLECLEKCPQQINIPEMMKKIKSVFENDQTIPEVFI